MFFFFQAEDGIRDIGVTGVQTCALPILCFAPEELYLYPLYVRPLTGLDRMGKAWDDHRLACYRAGRARLLAAGYTQVSRSEERRVGEERRSRWSPYH